jgi:integrase
MLRMIMRDGSGIVELRFVVEELDRHGNVRIYFRRQGKGGYRVRLRTTPGTEEFLAEYRQAAQGKPSRTSKDGRPPTAPGSLRFLIEGYYVSNAYLRLDPSTRAARRGILDGLCLDRFGKEPMHGEKPYARMDAGHVVRIRDQIADRPEAANGRVKALRQVFKWAISAKRAARNPARDVEYLKAKNPDGFHTWTTTEVDQYRARHPRGTKASVALALLLFVGTRRSDTVRLGRQMERDGWLRFTEHKGRNDKPKHREVPLLPELREELDAFPSDHLVYLVTEFGKPFTANGFGNWFRKRCNEAGLPHCSAHGLRKAGATIAAENGATEHQLMAMYGWESPKQAALYTRKANRKRLAGEAMHLIVPRLTEQKSDMEASPGTEVAASPGKQR